MKGILTTICAFALIGSAVSTFPNDLYFHHHPDIAIADTRGSGNIRHAQQQSKGHSRNNKNHYRTPPHRNAYHGGGHHRNSHGHRNSYGHHKRNFDDNQKGGIVYTAEGGIDWSKSQVSKVAAASNNNQQQGQRGQNYGTSQRDQRNPFDDNDYGYQQQSSNRRKDNNNYNNYNSYNSYNENDSYYDEDNEYESNNYGNSYSDNDYSGYSKSSGNGYNNDDNNYSDYDYNDRSNDYSDNDYDSYNNNNDDNEYDDYSYGNKQKYSNGRNAYTSSGGYSSPFSNGIRLAGALPDDGYNRGEGTFYDLETHIGTCGKQSKNTEYVVALNAEQMGDSSSRNQNCNKEVEITGPTGKTVKATIVDNCKTCKKGGLDLSPAAFEELGEFSHGSIPIKWKFV